VVDLNELGAKPFACPLGALSLGERGVRLVVEVGDVVAVARPPLELERVAPGREEGVTLPELGVTRPVPFSFPGEAGRPGPLVAGELELLFSHREAAARTRLGPLLEAEAVRALGAVLSGDGREGLVSAASEATSPESSLVGDDIARENGAMDRVGAGGWCWDGSSMSLLFCVDVVDTRCAVE
jgi:hypothetical protein